MDEQERFWISNFGKQYIDRNSSSQWVENNINFFKESLSSIEQNIHSVIEVGANIGLNIRALKKLYPKLEIAAIEINKSAASILRKEVDNVFVESIHTYDSTVKYDLVFTKGVLIHLNPEKIFEVYEKLARLSSRYVLIAEYYSPYPTSVVYRGNHDKLFKRDFAAEFLETNRDWKLTDYGFVYHLDKFPQDDLTWFLMEIESS